MPQLSLGIIVLWWTAVIDRIEDSKKQTRESGGMRERAGKRHKMSDGKTISGGLPNPQNWNTSFPELPPPLTSRPPPGSGVGYIIILSSIIFCG